MDDVIKYLIDFSSKEKVIDSKEIAKRFEISRVDVRRIINKARSEGIPICANRDGYYYSTDIYEINKTVGSLTGRISAISSAIRGLKRFGENETYYDSLI